MRRRDVWLIILLLIISSVAVQQSPEPTPEASPPPFHLIIYKQVTLRDGTFSPSFALFPATKQAQGLHQTLKAGLLESHQLIWKDTSKLLDDLEAHARPKIASPLLAPTGEAYNVSIYRLPSAMPITGEQAKALTTYNELVAYLGQAVLPSKMNIPPAFVVVAWK